MLGDEIIYVEHNGQIVMMYEWVYYFVTHCRGEQK